MTLPLGAAANHTEVNKILDSCLRRNPDRSGSGGGIVEVKNRSYTSYRSYRRIGIRGRRGRRGRRWESVKVKEKKPEPGRQPEG